MSTSQTLQKNKNTMFMNPLIKKLLKVTERAEEPNDAASYSGIAAKTGFFLLWSLIGIAAFFLFRPLLTNGPSVELESGVVYVKEASVFLAALVLSCVLPLLAFLIKPLVPVLGSLYCLFLGYSFVCISDFFPDYGDLIILAVLITVLLVGAMAFLYAKGIIKPNHKFKTVVTALFVTIVLSGIAGFICSFIPGLKEVTGFIMNNPVISIGGSVVYIIIACLFLVVDFDTIKQTVENQLPKKYEWIAAFGLAYTIFYLILKVFDLLVKIQDSSKK